MKRNSKILIVGHRSLVGSALLRRLRAESFDKIFTVPASLDPTNQQAVAHFFKKIKPDRVFLMDVTSGGIMANSAYPAVFIYRNLQAQANIIHSAWKAKTKKLIFIASSCIYPKECPQPMKEGYILTGVLEPTSEAFALAKIAGIKMCQYYNIQYGTNFISVIPATVYGKNDNFDLETSHVIPALIRKFHEAKVKAKRQVSIWGTGKPRREFLHVDDMVDGCLFAMKNPRIPGVINMGTGKDVSIQELSELLRQIVDFRGEVRFDARRPDGAYKKLLDSDRLKSLGWTAKVGLRTGLEDLYLWYTNSKNNHNKLKLC